MARDRSGFQLHRTRRFSDGRVEGEAPYGITSPRRRPAGAAPATQPQPRVH
ncbi:hypothetical protein [Gemmata massiliana]|uniref:hypothetical protein n=1 Tax=Gemmata massiliana TaxID=1210884 RepID=UPI0013A6A975|nr:hypothetical protein [Gemmata massiliana]